MRVLAKALRNNIGDMTFQEAYDKTGRILNITVSPSGGASRVPMLLNYLTSPHVLIWSATVASCAIPGIFLPVELMAKNHKGEIVRWLPMGLRWSDGSVQCDLPMDRLMELFNVNFFIVSQTNVHAPFFFMHQNSAVSAPMGWLISFLKAETKSFLKNISTLLLQIFSDNSTLFAAVAASVIPLLTQKYEGDVTITPTPNTQDILEILSNPTSEKFLRCLHNGERATWPHITRIRTQTNIECVLDQCSSDIKNQLLQRLEKDAEVEKQLHQPQQLRFGRVPSFHTSPSLVRICKRDRKRSD